MITVNLRKPPGTLWVGRLACPPLGSGFTLTARYLVDQGGEQVTEFDNGNWAHSNVWAGGKLTATYDTKGIHYELADPLGTKRVQANALGQVDETCASLPFGNDLGNPIGANCTTVANSLSTGDDATEHHFTQKERDTESGNDYFLARYYSSALGRFTTPDWSAKTDPVPYAVFADPQSLNLYAYVRNNPITAVDLDGHQQPCGFWCNISGQYDKLAASFYQSSQESTQKAAQQQTGVAASCPSCSTRDKAATAAENSALAKTIDGQKKGKSQEFGGWILQKTGAENEFSYTKPLANFDEGHFDPLGVTVPDGYSVAGWYHTHPHTKGNLGGEGFSVGDAQWSENHSRIGYVADTISRNMYRYTPGGPPSRDSVRHNGVYGTFVAHIPGDPYQ